MKTLAEFQAVYHLPLPELIFRASSAHRQHHDQADIQRCALLSIKTGGCPEDCGYCAQSAHFKTKVEPTPLMSLDEVREKAARAKELGATRFCMGTAWREVKDGPQFDRVLDMVRVVRDLDMEACVTLGMLTEPQAVRLKDAGLKKSDAKWFVYILRCSDGSLCTGITNDVSRRCEQHNAGTAFRYTRSRLPVALVYQEAQASRSLALKRELAIKALSRQMKESLIRLAG